MLSVQNLNIWYGPTEVVRDVSFEVPDGRVIGLMGGNGAGQSIAGLHPRDIVVAGLVQVPQGRFVWPGMTVRDNLELGAVTRHDKAEIRAGIDDAFALFPTLARKQKDRAGQLSGGEQQMVAVSRALMSRPRLMMMDEPSAGLAPRVVDEMVQAIKTLNTRGLAILLVEQNVGVAAALAEQAHVLANGELSFTASGRELASNPQVIRSYLGR